MPRSSMDPERRRLLEAALSLGASWLAFRPSASQAAPSAAPEDPARSTGRTLAQTGGYGRRSSFATEVRRKSTRNGLFGASFTPLRASQGILTPSGLHYEVHRAGVPSIDPARHRFVLHGWVRSPKVFSLADLLRFPSVSRFHFLECSDNGFSEWERPTAKDVQGTHGLTSNSEWTGVPLATLLREVGLRPGAQWLLAEGGDGSGLMRSIPLAKALDDALLVYAQNGEALRPEQGFPLRLLLPGFEGNMNIKWIRRIEVGDRPWMTRSETTSYTDLLPSGKARIFSFVMEVKSVITRPSGGMQLPGPGFFEITGLAWSGRGKIYRVEVSTDGGGHWQRARLQRPVLPKCHTRFRLPWRWDGRPAVLQSRAIDETGAVQPSLAALVAVRGTHSVNHNNAIQSWGVAADGSVSNIHHA